MLIFETKHINIITMQPSVILSTIMIVLYVVCIISHTYKEYKNKNNFSHDEIAISHDSKMTALGTQLLASQLAQPLTYSSMLF